RRRSAGAGAVAGPGGAAAVRRPASAPGPVAPAGRAAAVVAAGRAAQPAGRRLARAGRRDPGRASGRPRAAPGRGARSAAPAGRRTGGRRMSAIRALLGREVALAWGRGGGPLVALGFYAGVATLLPLAIGPEPERLAAIAPGAAWVALALAALLSLERLFERDYEDGALDLLVLGPAPLELTCAVKCLGQWVATGAPLALAAPVAAIGLGA